MTPSLPAGPNRTAYCVFIHAVAEGRVSAVKTDRGRPYLFNTRREAELDIADTMMTRLQEFIDGNRDFDDAVTLEEYVECVRVAPDGSVTVVDD